MFCPSCGTEYTIELKYCNRCGANLSAAIEPAAPPVIVNLTKPALIIAVTLMVLTIGGFGGLIGGALSLAPIVHGNDPLIAIIMFGMLTILIVDIFLVRQLSKLISASLSTTAPQPKQQNTFPNRPVVQLQQPLTPPLQAGGVTENTTRFFEPTYRSPSETENRPAGSDLKR